VEITLRERLNTFGYGDEMLDPHRSHARLGEIDGQPCFEPFPKFARLNGGTRIRIRDILSPGTKVKFLSSVLRETLGTSGLGLVFRAWDFLSRSKISSRPLFMGYVIGASNGKQFSGFPFDRFLTLVQLGPLPLDSVYQEDDGTLWKVGLDALLHVNDVAVLAEH
jgi:hypothetical protein